LGITGGGIEFVGETNGATVVGTVSAAAVSTLATVVVETVEFFGAIVATDAWP
jgi:hypothetical protein